MNNRAGASADQISRLKTVRDTVYSGNQSEMARETGVNPSTLSRLFSRDTESPSDETVVKVLNNVTHRDRGRLNEDWLRRGKGPMFDQDPGPSQSSKVRPRDEEKEDSGSAPEGIGDRAGRDPIYSVIVTEESGSLQVSRKVIGYVEGESALSGPSREIFWTPVRGDSMVGTLPKGGLVPVQTLKPTWTDLREDDIYLFRLENTVQVKRLQRRPEGRIQVVSDSDAYNDFSITLGDGTDLEILGRVLV